MLGFCLDFNRLFRFNECVVLERLLKWLKLRVNSLKSDVTRFKLGVKPTTPEEVALAR